ncbi:hypothetical protein ACR3K2_32710 [Cryptosporidium serpentis]
METLMDEYWININIGKSLICIINDWLNAEELSVNESLSILQNFNTACSEILINYTGSGRKLYCFGKLYNYNCIDGFWNITGSGVRFSGKSIGQLNSRYVKLIGLEDQKITSRQKLVNLEN